MTEQTFQPEQHPEPELRKRVLDPRGVLQKNLKPMLYLGAAVLVILAAVFSSHGKKGTTQQPTAKNEPPQPVVQDNTDHNIQDLKANWLLSERKRQTKLHSQQQRPIPRWRSRRLPNELLPVLMARMAKQSPAFPVSLVRRCPLLPTSNKQDRSNSARAAAGGATGGKGTRTRFRVALLLEYQLMSGTTSRGSKFRRRQ
jgi:hypothetical protein